MSKQRGMVFSKAYLSSATRSVLNNASIVAPVQIKIAVHMYANVAMVLVSLLHI